MYNSRFYKQLTSFNFQTIFVLLYLMSNHIYFVSVNSLLIYHPDSGLFCIIYVTILYQFFYFLQESCLLFCCLYRAWCHNPVATVALCFLTQNYKQAWKLLMVLYPCISKTHTHAPTQMCVCVCVCVCVFCQHTYQVDSQMDRYTEKHCFSQSS